MANNDIFPISQNFYCRIIFKDKVEYNPSNIISITVKEWAFEILPKIEIILKYDHTTFEKYPIEDNDIFSIYIANSNDNYDVMQIYAMVHDYRISVLGDDRENIIQITALLQCDNMFILKTKSYRNKNSYEVFQTMLSDNTGLLIENPLNIVPSDRMMWYQLNQNNYDFIKHVLKRAYVHDDAVFFYADHTGTFYYTALNKEMEKINKKSALFSTENYSSWTPEDADNTIWYNSYEFINLQGTVNKETNYGVKVEYYDLEKENNIEYSNFSRKLADLSFISKYYAGKVNFNYYGGILNNKNMYGKEYFESYVRNYFLKNNFLGLSLELNINPTINVKLFDKITFQLNSKISDSINKIYSGDYLVSGIVYFVAMNGVFQKRLYLSRNGMGLPDANEVGQYIPQNI